MRSAEEALDLRTVFNESFEKKNIKPENFTSFDCWVVVYLSKKYFNGRNTNWLAACQDFDFFLNSCQSKTGKNGLNCQLSTKQGSMRSNKRFDIFFELMDENFKAIEEFGFHKDEHFSKKKIINY